jgi:hypothetical protein
MRFMMLVIPKGYEKAAPGTRPDAKVEAAIGRYSESLRQAGVLLAVGAYWMIQVKTKAEAVEWASRCPVADDALMEVHPVHE